MKSFQLTPAGTVIVQLPAGVEITALQDGDGNVYVPMMAIAGAKEVAQAAVASPAPAAKKSAAAPVATKKAAAPVDEDEDDEDGDDDEDEAPAQTKTAGKTYTAKELKAIDDKNVLLKILNGRIDPADRDGKNTAEKYRRLIIEAQEAGDDEEEDEAPAAKPAKKGAAAAAPAAKSKKAPVVEEDDDEDDEEAEDESLTGQIESVLTELDAQDITLKKAVVKIMKLATKKGANEAKVTKLVSAFEKDNDSDTEETAALIEAEISDAKPAKKQKADAKPAAKGKKAAVVEDEDDEEEEDEDGDEGEIVEISDLKKGDSVAVFWAKMDEWYSGTVASVKKGVVTVDYEDETSEILDPEAHTEIRRYADSDED